MMMAQKSRGIGERHKKILQLLQEYADKGYPPSIREICDRTGISSTSVVNYYLDQLHEWGYIQRDRHISRGLRVVPEMVASLEGISKKSAAFPPAEFFNIPVTGRIAAGLPLLVPASDFSPMDADSTAEVALSMLPAKKVEGLFCLEVDGESMIDAMVNDGDLVVLRPVEGNYAANGEMVAIYLPARDETTLKYFFKEKDHYRLQPANPTMGPIIINKDEPIEIRGTVVLVIRKLGKTDKVVQPGKKN